MNCVKFKNSKLVFLLSFVNKHHKFAARLYSKSTFSPGRKLCINKAQKPDVQISIVRHLAEMACSVKTPNRLALEKSPYLLQHATNPVDWYPWGEEAFSKATKENKMIFLSIGYSTCHWCHVMERESFENEEIAKIMNDNFVCIKVDREERPDVDKLYMLFVQVNTGRGGWPLSVWLTPNLQPIFGGTYFPPDDNYGRPGFKTILSILNTQWRESRQKFSESGQKVIEFIEETSSLDNSVLDPTTSNPPDISCQEKCYNQLARSYEKEYGGFSHAPKFPHLVNMNFLFHAYAREPNTEHGKKALEMCTYTLKMMAKGGIHDHIGQGFARYSVDNKWHVPHFEKMLYDQGQLAVSYASAYLTTKDQFFADVLEGILSYVNRDLSHPAGGFYSAEDADSLPTLNSTEKKEGAFYVWTHDEIKNLLKQTVVEKPDLSYSDIFSAHYNVEPTGNVNPAQDPHSELENQNVLIVTGSEAETASKFNLPEDRVNQILKECRKLLFEFREKRPRPQLDDKIITSWNGLMISGFAKAGQALGNSNHVQRAVGAAKFVRQHLYNNDSKTLLRSCYKATDNSITQVAAPINGFLDDYAFLIRGLLDLYEVSFDPVWIEWAESLQETQDKLFWDEGGAGYFGSSSGDSSILVRIKEDHDGSEPSGNSVSAHNLLRLSALLDRSDYKERAKKLLSAFTSRLIKTPYIIPEMVSALMLYHDGPTQILITGKLESSETAALLDIVQSRLIPNRVLALVGDDKENILYKKNEIIRTVKSINGRATAYVCHHHTCSLPVTTREELSKLLDQSKLVLPQKNMNVKDLVSNDQKTLLKV